MNKTDFSCVVSKALDTMKYGYDDIKARVKIYKTVGTIENKPKADDDTFCILAGSRAEGVSYADDSDSDIDIMMVIKQWICCDNLHKFDLDAGKVVLEMPRDNTAPGYTRLKCKDSDQVKIKSDIFPIQEIEGQKFVGHLLDVNDLSLGSVDDEFSATITGPAVTHELALSSANTNTNLTFPVKSLSLDGVFAMPCNSTEHLQKWKERKRFNSWPGKNLIDEISKMNGHVVPVGSNGSENAHLEWRICYTEAELKLTHSLNEIQLKLYVLLRMVAKKILKPICADISSYVVKNILFWFLERSPAYRFKDEHLMGLLYLALRSLQHCIHRKHLSNYLIPERNLFAARFSDNIKTRLVEKLHQLIYVQGPSFFLHYKDLTPLGSAVAQIQLSHSVHEQSRPNAVGSRFPNTTKQFLQTVFARANKDQEELLTTILSGLTQKQTEHNILDILCVFGILKHL